MGPRPAGFRMKSSRGEATGFLRECRRVPGGRAKLASRVTDDSLKPPAALRPATCRHFEVGSTLSFADFCVAPSVAVIVTSTGCRVWLFVGGAVKVTFVAPPCTCAVGCTPATDGSLLERSMSTPPAGAGPLMMAWPFHVAPLLDRKSVV